MKVKNISPIERIRLKFADYKMKDKDKKLFIESLALIFIYFVSFVILSLGRVQQKFLGISEGTFSSIQIIILTFVFAVVITLVIYFTYKQAIK